MGPVAPGMILDPLRPEPFSTTSGPDEFTVTTKVYLIAPKHATFARPGEQVREYPRMTRLT